MSKTLGALNQIISHIMIIKIIYIINIYYLYARIIGVWRMKSSGLLISVGYPYIFLRDLFPTWTRGFFLLHPDTGVYLNLSSPRIDDHCGSPQIGSNPSDTLLNARRTIPICKLTADVFTIPSDWYARIMIKRRRIPILAEGQRFERISWAVQPYPGGGHRTGGPQLAEPAR